MKQFFLSLLGMPAEVFFTLLFWAMFGVALTTLIDVAKRDPNSDHTPTGFSMRFFWRDNAKKLIAGFMIILASLRFGPELFGVTITDFWALAIGVGSDSLALIIKNRTNILNNKKTT
jgi:hypothetical protein